MFSRFSLQRGFTLIELLVVMGILGILMTMGTLSFNTAQRAARDTQRLSDMTTIQKQMESYRTLHNGYSCTEADLKTDKILPDSGFPTDPKTKTKPSVLSYLQNVFKSAQSQLVPKAYAQSGTCLFCVNTTPHAQQCTAQGGTVGFTLTCNSHQCCFPGGGGGASPAPSASPVPSPVPSPTPTGAGAGGSGSVTDLGYSFSACTTTAYCACAKLERAGTGNATDRNCTWATGGSYFCVQQAL